MDLIQLPQFPSVAASAKSTLVTDRLVDRTVLGLIFERGGTSFTAAHLAGIRARFNGKDVVNGLTGPQLTDLNEYDLLTTNAAYTVLFFGDPTARTVRGQYQGAIDFGYYRFPLELEIDIGAATAPTLAVYAITANPKREMGLGFDDLDAARYRTFPRTVIQPAAAVTRKSYGLSLGSSAGPRIRRIAFFHTAITSVEYKKGGLTKHDNISDALNSAFQTQFARAPQSGLYMLDRVVDGNQGEAELTVRDDGRPWTQEVNITTSGADTITAFADVISTFDQAA